jgi:hypothetical protein
MTTVQQPSQLTPEMMAGKNYPKVAFYLAAIGALFMLFAGLFAIFFDALYLAIVWNAWAGLTALIIGILLVIDSLIIGGAATSLVLKPEMHTTAGVTIVLFSLLALLLGFGWFWVLGAGLGIIGGILAIFWKPTAT